ncbi:cell adhesion molecule 4 [Spinachia spinachia]
MRAVRCPAPPPAPFSLALRSLFLVLLCSTRRCQAVQAENVTVLEGGTAEISCRLQNYDGSIVVIQNPRRQTLFFNGTRALKDDRFQMVLFSPRLVRIELTNVSVSDEGGYFCQLYTDATHHQVATLSVSVPPETPTVEVKQEAVEGGEVELACVSPRSRPAATLRWIRNGREVPGVKSEQENMKTFSVSNTIRVPVERKDNGAALSCEALHPALAGQKKIRHYRLDVNCECLLQDKRVHVGTGGYVLLAWSVQVSTGCVWNPRSLKLIPAQRRVTNKHRLGLLISTVSLPLLFQCASFLPQNVSLACAFSSISLFLCPPPPRPPHTPPTPTSRLFCSFSDPGAVVETHSAVPYAVIGGVLALLVFTVICALIVTIWCSVRQKGSYLTHEASGLDEHGEVQEAFLNGNDASQGKKEYLL